MCPISDSAIAEAIYRGLCTLSQLRRGGLHFRFWSILKVGNGPDAASAATTAPGHNRPDDRDTASAQRPTFLLALARRSSRIG